MFYVKLMWCSGLPWVYGQLEEGVGQSVMKCIQCSGLTWIYGQLEEGGQSVMKIIWCNCLPEIHAQLTLAQVGLSAKFEFIYVSCFSVVVLYGSMVNWRRGQGSVCHENYLV